MVESGELNMYMGEYHHNLDEKGRLIVPAKFRELLGDKFVITRGIEKCLYVYSMSDWQKIAEKLDTLPFTRKDARIFNRAFFSGAIICDVDRQGRVLIAPPLITYANLEKECVVIGANDRIEIWNIDGWNDFLGLNEYELDKVAENLFDGVNS